MGSNLRRGDDAGRRKPPAIERLAAADLMLTWPEEQGWPQHIGALAVLDAAPLLDEQGDLRIEALRAHVERRLHMAPRLRQIVAWPRRGLGWPHWVDAPRFDVAAHVGVFPVPPPGDETQLLAACEELRRRPFDRSRPPWGMWLLPGLSDGRVGWFIKLHHAIADGVSGVATLGALVDPVADAGEIAAPRWTPAPPPSERDLFRDNLQRRMRELRGTFAALAAPVRTARRLRRAWPSVREVFGEGPAPRTSCNRRIGSHRRLAVIRGKLDLVRSSGRAQGGTVNDVLLDALAGGYAELLRGRGERVDGRVLRAFVPVSLHSGPSGQARGNVDGGMVAPLPIGEPDPIRRLRLIASATAERKRRPRPLAGRIFRSIWIQRAFLRYMPHQRVMNAYAANVPGPPIEMYFAGARILELFPLVPITANISIGAGALSYAGQFNITVVADRDLCPDLDVFIRGVTRALDALARPLDADDGNVVRPGEAAATNGGGGKVAPTRRDGVVPVG